MTIPSASDNAMNPDWVWSNNSNVSVAKDRGWFTSYTSFASHLGSLLGGSVAVAGIGSVCIPVKVNSQKGSKSHGTLTIHNVLHAPGIVCNILGQGDFMDRYQIDIPHGIKDHAGSRVACWDEKKDLFCLKLSGHPVGPRTTTSIFLKSSQGNDAYYINARWPDTERARWEATRPYTDEEKAWLKQHFKTEFHFLRQHGLSIYKDEDREEGKTLLRSFIADGRSDARSEGQTEKDFDDISARDDEDEEEEEEDSFLDDLEADPMSHMADYKFSIEELDWIKKHYKHSANFLRSYGLKPFDDEDVDEGQSIVKAMMSDDD